MESRGEPRDITFSPAQIGSQLEPDGARESSTDPRAALLPNCFYCFRCETKTAQGFP